MESRFSKFHSCSYEELTNCVRFRIQTIRQYRRFLETHSLPGYPDVRFRIKLAILTEEQEIRDLMEMRRMMKRCRAKTYGQVWHMMRKER